MSRRSTCGTTTWSDAGAGSAARAPKQVSRIAPASAVVKSALLKLLFFMGCPCTGDGARPSEEEREAGGERAVFGAVRVGDERGVERVVGTQHEAVGQVG